MTETNISSHNGFKYGIIALSLIIVMLILISTLSNDNLDITSMAIGLLIICAGIVSIIGLLKSIKGISEPNTAKKIIGIILNLGIAAFFIFVIVANFSDLYKYFTNSY